MCRMVGLVAASPVFTRGLLRDAPRSLWALSREHPDGWGVAVREAADWSVHRGTACAQTSPEYDTLAATTHARVLIAHVRQRTVGETSLRNTHPFRRDGYVFAHNGTVTALPALAARTSGVRAAEITGDTDSERLLAFLATCIDESGDIERGLTRAVREMHAIDSVGSVNFLFSCGRRVYAHRLGRSLFALVRHAAQEARRTPAVVIASERLTDEHWTDLPDRTLWVVEDDATGPALRALI